MNIDKIRYFVTTVECLSFSKAAQQHYITQAAISQHIASMESELGAKLFIRSHVKISLTEEGKIFYEACKKILLHYNNALNRILTYQREQRWVLTVGYSSLFEKELLSAAIRNKAPEDNVKLQFVCLPIPALKHALQNERLDLALTFNTDYPNGIEKKVVYCGTHLLGVALSHRWAGQNSIDGSELANEDIIMYAENEEGGIPQSMLDHCAEDGYTPHIVETVTSIESMTLLVELDRGVGFFPDKSLAIYNDSIHFLRINNTHHKLEICAAWKKNNESPHINKLIKILERDRS